MRRLAVVLLSAIALLTIGLAGPASAVQGFPPGCHLNAGKIAASTSTVTRSINVRWPGVTCDSTVNYGVTYYAWLNTWNGSTWAQALTPFYQQPVAGGTIFSTPGVATIAHCGHRTLVRVKVQYLIGTGHSGGYYYQAYYTNAAVCS